MLVHDFSSQQRSQKITLIKLYTLNFLNSLPQTYTGDPRVRPWLNQGPTLYFVAPTKDPRVRPWLNKGATLYLVAQMKDPRVRPWLNQGPTLYLVAQTKVLTYQGPTCGSLVFTRTVQLSTKDPHMGPWSSPAPFINIPRTHSHGSMSTKDPRVGPWSSPAPFINIPRAHVWVLGLHSHSSLSTKDPHVGHDKSRDPCIGNFFKSVQPQINCWS